LAKNRLVHFAVLGGAIFLVAPRPSAGHNVEIPGETLEALHGMEARRLGRGSLSDDKIREVDERAVEDEVLYREALRLGLDVGDPIVRQRLLQKVLFLAEDLGGASNTPSEGELRAYYEATKDQWARPVAIHFVHVFASSEAKARELTSEVEHSVQAGAPNLGEPFPYARDVTLTRDEIAALYGTDFAKRVAELAPGVWSGPASSRLGWHLVRIVERRGGGGPPAFEEVRSEIALKYALERREKVVGAFLERAFRRYAVRAGGVVVTDLAPSKRVALRTESSAED
jgi:hypothetical protein